MQNEGEALLIIALMIAAYFIPTIVAVKGKHRNVTAVFLVNLFFGFTVIGWIIALIWAVSKPQVIVIDRQA